MSDMRAVVGMDRERYGEQDPGRDKFEADPGSGPAHQSGSDATLDRISPGNFVERQLAALRTAICDTLAQRQESVTEVVSRGTPDELAVASLSLLSDVCAMLISAFRELGSNGHQEGRRPGGRGAGVDQPHPVLRATTDSGRHEAVRERENRVIRAAEGSHVFRPEGEYWTVAYEGRVARLKAMRGFQYIAHLLRHPHRETAAIDLVSLGETVTCRMSRQELAEQDLRIVGFGGGDPLLDSRARAEYRNRLRDLYQERDWAQRDNDLGRLTKLQAELEALANHLAVATRRGGGSRPTPSPAERARVNVRNCFTAATKTIKPHNPALSRHLMNTIKTGTFCCYVPDRPIEWLL